MRAVRLPQWATFKNYIKNYFVSSRGWIFQTGREEPSFTCKCLIFLHWSFLSVLYGFSFFLSGLRPAEIPSYKKCTLVERNLQWTRHPPLARLGISVNCGLDWYLINIGLPYCSSFRDWTVLFFLKLESLMFQLDMCMDINADQGGDILTSYCYMDWFGMSDVLNSISV